MPPPQRQHDQSRFVLSRFCKSSSTWSSSYTAATRRTRRQIRARPAQRRQTSSSAKFRFFRCRVNPWTGPEQPVMVDRKAGTSATVKMIERKPRTRTTITQARIRILPTTRQGRDIFCLICNFSSVEIFNFIINLAFSGTIR